MIAQKTRIILLMISCLACNGEINANSGNGINVWFHPFSDRRNGELENFERMDKYKYASGAKLFYGMRFELPWSRFAETPGQPFNWKELDELMKNARDFDYKVYVVLNDKTWYNGHVKTDNWPVPNNYRQDRSKYFVVNKGKPVYPRKSAKEIRIALRWYMENNKPLIENWYLDAIEAIAKRINDPDPSSDHDLSEDYKQLAVISLGESSLGYGYAEPASPNADVPDEKRSLAELGYPGAMWYRTYLIRILGRAINRIKKHNPNLKIAMNLNWIPGQSENSPEWFQHEVLRAVAADSNAAQAIEDVHPVNAWYGKDYWERIYRYTLDTQDNSRTVPRNRVWAHISCDTKNNGKGAAENYTIAKQLADNIVIRWGTENACDGSTTFQQYVNEAGK